MRNQQLAHNMLEIIDFSDGGVPVTKIEEIMMEAVSFSLFVKTLNILIDNQLVYVDSEHRAHRVRKWR